MSEGIGASVTRKEDKKFLTGKGRYTDDINRPGQTHAYFVRSDVAHANIKSIDIKAASSADGVVAVYTGEDVVADGIGGPICGWVVPCRDGSPTKEPPHPILANEKVRYVGDHVAVVIAETLAQAKSAAELVEVEYEELPAVVDLESASSSAEIHKEVPDNCYFDWELGDEASTDKALKSSSIIGKPLKDIKLPKDVSLGAIVKEDERIVSPRGDTIIEAGDMVVMFVPVKSMKKVEELLSVNLDFF